MEKPKLKGGEEEKEDFKNSENLNEDIKEGEMAYYCKLCGCWHYEGSEIHKKHNPRFHLVYFDKENKSDPQKSLDNLVGFTRSSSFDGQKELPEGERYLGAMNIDPILQKFYFGLGLKPMSS